MKYCSLALLAVGLYAQQSSTTTYTYDVNGRAHNAVSLTQGAAPGAAEKRQTTQNVNGRQVPIDDIEEKVISDDGKVRVVERLFKQYDANGRPGPPEKSRIETRKNSDGSTSVATLTYKADINGRLNVAERSVAQITKTADATTTSTMVERPDLNGGLALYEKREELRRDGNNGAYSESTTTLRPDGNGRLSEIAKTSVEKKVEGGAMVENAARYELGALVKQTSARTVKTGAGEQTVLDVFVAEEAGKVRSARETAPKLRERQIIDKSVTGSGSTETVSVQLPSPNDPGRLSNPKVVEQIVCTGKCTQ